MAKIRPLPKPNTIIIRKVDGARKEVHIDKDGYEWGYDTAHRPCRVAFHHWYSNVPSDGKTIAVGEYTISKKIL